MKPPVLSKFEPEAMNELSTAASLNGAGACLQWYIFSRQAYGKSCMKKVANDYLTVTKIDIFRIEIDKCGSKWYDNI